MYDRPNDMRRIRPEIGKTQLPKGMTDAERFQNNILRPILKLQNPLLLAVFQNYIEKRKGVFYTLHTSKRLEYIEKALFKDQKFRHALQGMIIGLFTVAEYQQYSKNASALNKRMMHLLSERLKGQVQAFELMKSSDKVEIVP